MRGLLGIESCSPTHAGVEPSVNVRRLFSEKDNKCEKSPCLGRTIVFGLFGVFSSQPDG